MKRFIYVAIMAAALMFVAVDGVAAKSKKARADEATAAWDYEVETMGQNRRSGHVLKVWSYSRATHIAEEQCKKNAIHAVVFRGVPANEAKRLQGIRPLLLDATAEQQHEAFFKQFFAEGVKVSKGPHKYKVGLTITVDTPSLRRYLESAGVVVSLNKGFN